MTLAQVVVSETKRSHQSSYELPSAACACHLSCDWSEAACPMLLMSNGAIPHAKQQGLNFDVATGATHDLKFSSSNHLPWNVVFSIFTLEHKRNEKKTQYLHSSLRLRTIRTCTIDDAKRKKVTAYTWRNRESARASKEPATKTQKVGRSPSG